MRTRFDEQLSELNDMLIEMGVMIEKAIKNATRAIVDHEKKRAKKAIEMDSEIDQQEKDIESLCLQLLLRQQPVAKDLRLISAAMKMVTDMERIGDQAADISEIAKYLIGKENLINLETIPLMAEATSRMVTDAIDAFVKKDLELAQKVIDYDDVVDELFHRIRNDVISLIQNDSACGEQAVDYMMVAKYFERIGDHATNIAEWVVFSITGKHIGDEISV
jgi:phosphate transport system protein